MLRSSPAMRLGARAFASPSTKGMCTSSIMRRHHMVPVRCQRNADSVRPGATNTETPHSSTRVIDTGSTSSGSSVEEDAASSRSMDDQSLSPSNIIADSLGSEVAEGENSSNNVSSPAVAAVSLVGIAVLLGGGYLAKDQIKDFLDFFVVAVDEWGPWGYAAYAGVYTALEVLAVPAIPLTMTAGVVFGPVVGTVVTSISGTVAATIAFLIARYAARDKVLAFAKRSKRFAAIDKAIGKDGFKFVTLLRLSPLLPLAASNYLYGLTAVELGPYMAGSFVGMLPGTYAYVSAGHVGKAVLTEGEGSLSPELWQVGLGLGVTVLALGFVGKLAKQALEEVEEEEGGAK